MSLIKELIYRIRGEYTVDRLKKMGLTVGENFNPQLGFELDPSHCWLIEIGDNVTFGPHVQVLAHDASTCIHTGYAKIGRVVIGNNVFIGANTVILPGVTIGDNVIIGAGSVVTKSIGDCLVCGGNPAKPLQTLDEYIMKHKLSIEHSPIFGEEYTLRQAISDEKKEEMKQKLLGKGGYVK